MSNILLPRLLATLLAASTLAGCAELSQVFERKPDRVHVRTLPRAADKDDDRQSTRSERAEAQSGREQAALREGIRLYNEGDFNGAIKRLGSNDIRSNSPARIRLEALKYTAFSYCVTSRPKQCEQAFEKALKIDPDFSLESGEQGHPLWGPAYDRAKKG